MKLRDAGSLVGIDAPARSQRYAAMRISWVLVVTLLSAFSFSLGCGKKKEITSLQRKEAATLVSEADFAITLRDYKRAEGLLTKATSLASDNASYWIALGTVRVRLGQRETAKTAYQRGLKELEDFVAANKTDVSAVLEQVSALALLGRVNEARAFLEKLPARFPGNSQVRSFIERKQLDQMIADPKFKEIAL